MFESIGNFFKKVIKTETKELGSKDDAKERLHLVLMQDRANVSADFLELMKQEIIDVIKKYIVVDEGAIDVRLTNKQNDGAPALYANIPIMNIKNDMKAEKIKEFEGVNFNKKLEDIKEEEAKKEKVEETISEMIDNATEKENKKEIKEKDSKKKTTKKKITRKKKEEPEEVPEVTKEDIEEEEEADDDVTFDDLLKAAEEEDIKKVSKGK